MVDQYYTIIVQMSHVDWAVVLVLNCHFNSNMSQLARLCYLVMESIEILEKYKSQ